MIKNSTRSHFLKTTALASLSFATSSFDFIKHKPLLSFSTLGCPDWSLETILNFAVKNGYDGIELRGIQRQLDLTKCPEFSSEEKILATRKLIEGKKLKVINLGTSVNMHHADKEMRKKNLDMAKSFIQLAQQLDCPYIRVFPNNFPKEQKRKETIELIVNGLNVLGDCAKDKGVTVLMETHGDVIYSADLEEIMQLVGHPNVGLGWDIANIWAITKEPPGQVYAKLKKYIRLAHIKDLKWVNKKAQLTLMGNGDAPIFDAIDILAKGGYKGYYSFEWEKLWYPEIEEPEVAIAHYAKVMRQHFRL